MLAREFYRDAIKNASKYCRAAGYFSSSVFSVARGEFADFFENGGSVELVCGPFLSPADLDAICDGLLKPSEWVGRPVPNGQCGDLLRWALACGRFHIKIAFIAGHENVLYHEKFGVFFDGDRPVGAYEGSANETRSGFWGNFERVVTFSGDSELAREHRRQLATEFDLLWDDQTQGLSVLPIEDAIRQNLIVLTSSMSGASESPTVKSTVSRRVGMPPEILRRPSRLVLRDYQSEAVNGWLTADGCGILEMATGSGKTITALTAVTSVFEQCGPPLVIVIVAPLLHLVEQWATEATAFGLDPIQCGSHALNWEQYARAAVHRCNSGQRPVVSLVATNATFMSTRFKEILASVSVRTVLVADEVHNLGAGQLANALPTRVSLRLGLSATPERWHDPIGNQKLRDYFGNVVFQFTLRDALSHIPPVLTPYRYYPILVDLDDDEQEEYLDLTRAIGRCMSSTDMDSIGPLAKSLLIKRSRILASARNKLTALSEQMQPHAASIHNLIYCGDSSVEFSDSELDSGDSRMMRQIDAVTSLVGHGMKMSTAQFTASTSTAERTSLLKRFAAVEIQVLVAIHCLDEGVDIPSITRAFILASSTNPRQFIQRRGRILRRAPGKESAEIYDFVIRPPSLECRSSDPAFQIGRKLVQRELAMVSEFAQLALNGPEARLVLLPLLKEWNLLHIV